METLLTIPATITTIKTMSRNQLRLHIDTNENLSVEEMARIMRFYDQFGYLFFQLEKPITPQQVAELIPDLPKVEGKAKPSPSQKLRSILWRYWEYKGITTAFEAWYPTELARIGSAYLLKIN